MEIPTYWIYKKMTEAIIGGLLTEEEAWGMTINECYLFAAAEDDEKWRGSDE